jgi:hypothetical protein
VRGGGSDWEVLGQCDIVIDYGLHTINELNKKKRKKKKRPVPVVTLVACEGEQIKHAINRAQKRYIN